MNEFSISFWLGLLFTILLFALSLVLVLGVKTAYSALKKLLPQKTQIAPERPPVKKPSQPKVPQVVRTIEIDPNQVDKIYVKKAQ